VEHGYHYEPADVDFRGFLAATLRIIRWNKGTTTQVRVLSTSTLVDRTIAKLLGAPSLRTQDPEDTSGLG
jgi:hypothetical protein